MRHTYIINLLLNKNFKWGAWVLNSIAYAENKMLVCTNYQLLPNFFLINCFSLSKNFLYLNDFLMFDTIYKFWRFELTVLLNNVSSFLNLSIKQKLMENQELISLTFWYKNANWLEREIWELFGVKFFFNSNLGRLLLDYNFSGFPLRKDFYYEGYHRANYDLKKHNIHLFF